MKLLPPILALILVVLVANSAFIVREEDYSIAP